MTAGFSFAFAASAAAKKSVVNTRSVRSIDVIGIDGIHERWTYAHWSFEEYRFFALLARAKLILGTQKGTDEG